MNQHTYDKWRKPTSTNYLILEEESLKFHFHNKPIHCMILDVSHETPVVHKIISNMAEIINYCKVNLKPDNFRQMEKHLFQHNT